MQLPVPELLLATGNFAVATNVQSDGDANGIVDIATFSILTEMVTLSHNVMTLLRLF